MPFCKYARVATSWPLMSAPASRPLAPMANPRASGGLPVGANFPFEDGSVSWRKFNLGNYRTTIDVGSKASGWVVFYRPADLTAGPW